MEVITIFLYYYTMIFKIYGFGPYVDIPLNFLSSYNYIFISIFFLFCFCSILLLVSFFLSPKLNNSEKNLPYECGFNPFEDTRSVFEIHFYKVAILFIIFDLEIAFLLPWVVVYNFMGFFSYWVIMIFLFILVLGFVYEFISGSLDWE